MNKLKSFLTAILAMCAGVVAIFVWLYRKALSK
jgi:hypothetical protein